MEESKIKNTEKSTDSNAKSTASTLKNKFDQASKNRTVKFIISAIKKPSSAFKEYIADYSDFKNTWQLPVFASIAYTIINLFNTVISKVYTAPHKTLFGQQVSASWNWKRLEKIDWFQTIGSSFISYLIPILFVAGVYYVVSLIFKKTSNFFRLLTIVAVATVPTMIVALVITPLISIISAQLGTILFMSGISYGSIMAYEALNEEIGYKGNERIFANLIFMVALYTVFVLLFNSLLKSSLGGSTLPLNSLNNLFNK